MLALRWKDIQKTDDGLVIHVPSMQKTKKTVIVPLGEQALKWLPKQGLEMVLKYEKSTLKIKFLS